MASGSSKGFDFASDDILCSYEDYANQEASNGSHSDSAIASNSAKEFHKSRMARTSVFPASSYSPPDDSGNQDVIIAAVDRSMKKYSDNLMRFLEGLSSRLSQLELYCYNLDKSIGEMRSDLGRDHNESDSKLKFLEKHVQEVHRSVQILRDKQELADTQKELAKLQLAQKESSSGHNSQQNDERSSTPSPDTKKNDNPPELHGQELALALPHQVAPPPAALQPPQRPAQPQAAYYLPGPPQLTQSQYLPSESQYRTPPPPPQSQVNQPPPPQQQPQLPPQYQQWNQQVPPQPALRPSSAQVYPSYHPSPPANAALPEPPQNTMPMQMQMQIPYSAIPQPSGSQAMTYAYGGHGGAPVQPAQPQPQPPPQQLKPAFGGQPAEAYAATGPQRNTYMMYETESGRIQHQHQHPIQPAHFPQAGYPPNPQQPTGGSGGSMMGRPAQQFMRSHPYNELIDKLVSMGYRGDHVMSVIQRLEETGQTVDFNAILDRLNGHSSGSSQRGWSG